MSSRIEHKLDQYLFVRSNVVNILADVARAERYLSKPNNKRCPSMYKLLETYYDPKDWGYHVTKELKLRATPQQMQNYDTAIDLLLMIDETITDEPVLMRKVMWLKANRMKWTSLGKYFGIHRSTIKRMYDNVLDRLINKIIKDCLDILAKKFN